MAINGIDSTLVKSVSGRCYAGQTYDEAKTEGGRIYREFKRLNKDGDSVLSQNEVLESRNKKAAIWKTVSNIFLLLALYRCASGILANSSEAIMAGCMEKLDLTTKAVNTGIIINLLIDGGIGLLARHKAKNINKESQNMISTAKEIAVA